MQQIDKSSCGVFTIACATNIAFGFDPKKSQHVLTQMRTHLQNSINTNTSFPSQNIYPFFKKQFIVIGRMKQCGAQICE